MKVLDYFNFPKAEAIGAAGSVYSNTSDMLKWINLNLNQGIFETDQLLDSQIFKDCHTSQMINNTRIQKDVPEIEIYTYGLGWFVELFKGHKIVHHGGAIDGFLADVTLIPELNAGFVVLTNENGSIIPGILHYALMDYLMGNEAFDTWTERVDEITKSAKAEMAAKLENVVANADTNLKQPLPNAAYVGEYYNEGYGTILVQEKDNNLYFKVDRIDAKLENITLNTMIVDLETAGKIPLKFNNDILGGVESFNFYMDPLLPEGIVFKKGN